METTVIRYNKQFEHHVSDSIASKAKDLFFRAITFWIPKASPDYDKNLKYIQYWYLEIENSTGKVEREIGFSNHNEPIIYAPTDRNYGLWTDSDKKFNIENYQIIDKKIFDESWDYLLTHNNNM